MPRRCVLNAMVHIPACILQGVFCRVYFAGSRREREHAHLAAGVGAHLRLGRRAAEARINKLRRCEAGEGAGEQDVEHLVVFVGVNELKPCFLMI